MHLTRQFSPTSWPVPRKGTKYLAVPASHTNSSVPLVIAVRDILHLANTAKEVHQMIKMKSLKINEKVCVSLNESIKLFQILEADKPYRLNILPTGKFFFEEYKDKTRLCKINGKKIVAYGIQYNLHEGSNFVSKEKYSTNDSLYLDMKGKLVKHVSLDKGKEIMVIAGKYQGLKGKIDSVLDSKIKVKLKDKEGAAELDKASVIVL